MSVFHVCWDGSVGGGGGGGRGVSGRLKRRKAIMGDFLLAQWGRDPALSDRLRCHISALTHQHAHMHALQNRCGSVGRGGGVCVGGGQAPSSLMPLH